MVKLDIICGFEPQVEGSSPSGGTKNKMKKFILISLFLLAIATPTFAADRLVPCDGPDCDICNFFQMLVNVYQFIVFQIATPLAVIALTVGGIFMMISAGNPGLFGKGKTILWAAIIGLVLVFGSFLIINTILTILGYNQGLGNINISC